MIRIHYELTRIDTGGPSLYRHVVDHDRHNKVREHLKMPVDTKDNLFAWGYDSPMTDNLAAILISDTYKPYDSDMWDDIDHDVWSIALRLAQAKLIKAKISKMKITQYEVMEAAFPGLDIRKLWWIIRTDWRLKRISRRNQRRYVYHSQLLGWLPAIIEKSPGDKIIRIK